MIQHEYDHREGVVFTDRLSPLRRNLIKSKLMSLTKGRYKCSYKTKSVSYTHLDVYKRQVALEDRFAPVAQYDRPDDRVGPVRDRQPDRKHQPETCLLYTSLTQMLVVAQGGEPGFQFFV